MFTKPNKHLTSATVKRDLITFAVYGNFTAGVSWQGNRLLACIA